MPEGKHSTPVAAENMQLQSLEVFPELKVSVSLSDEFHTVNHLIPDNQVLHTISPDTLVIEALKIMRENHYSQIPVLAGNTVLGVFSYRSFAENFLKLNTGKDKPDLEQLKVREFVEKPLYVQVSDDIEPTLKSLSENDYLLVGQRERLLALITSQDLARYTYLFASILMLFREIELTVRKIIQASLDEKQFQDCAQKTLSGIYPADKLPKSVNEMTLSDYAQLIGDGRCYPHFARIFGDGEWHRKKTRSKLDEIRELRNDAFHFRRDLVTQDIENLFEHRDWLKNLAIAYEAETNEKGAEK